MTEAYPLAWPVGWKRTNAFSRKPARFTITSDSGDGYKSHRDITIAAAARRLADELRRLKASEIVLSTNVELRRDGEPRQNRASPADPGVAVYFKLAGKDRVLACDRWDKVAGNIAAVAAHIDAIRRQDRYGVGTLDQAFAGYAALPPPGGHAKREWRQVLGLHNPETLEAVKSAYRYLARQHHPDAGGNPRTFAEINDAWKEAQQELKNGR